MRVMIEACDWMIEAIMIEACDWMIEACLLVMCVLSVVVIVFN